MSIKKLFDSNKPQAVLKSTSLEEEVVKNAPQLESADNVREQIKRINRFIPQVDYSDPANFVVYGSAQSYYEDAVNRIITKYPYDGSEEEVTEFLNESNYLDLHILENEYPKTTGYIRFPEGERNDPAAVNNFGSSSYSTHVTFFAGPNAIAGGMTTGSFHTQFTSSNYYDTDIYQTDGTLALDRVGSRESNLEFDLENKGATVEFWLDNNVLRRDRGAVTIFAKQNRHVLYDMWNGSPSSSADYGRLTIFASGTQTAGAYQGIFANVYSGTVGSSSIELLSPEGKDIKGTAYDHEYFGPCHLAFTFKSTHLPPAENVLNIKSYINGKLSTHVSRSIGGGGGLAIKNVDMRGGKGRIGALLTNPSGNSHGTDMAGYGTSTHMEYDDFRYWKTERTAKQIYENFWKPVRGGNNNEVANAELGVYFKFNEGNTEAENDGTGTEPYLIDSTVLDYSGRVSNGTIYRYNVHEADPRGGLLRGPFGITRQTGSSLIDDFSVFAMNPFSSRAQGYLRNRYYDGAGTNPISIPTTGHVAGTIRGGVRKTSYFFSKYTDMVLIFAEQNKGQGIPADDRRLGDLVFAKTLPPDSSVFTGSYVREPQDPIIRASHPEVTSTLNRLSTSGSIYDFENQASLMDSLPSWLVEDDALIGQNGVKKLTQILGSYFDTLNLQVKSLPDLTDTTYTSASNKPIPFARNLLSSKGLTVPEIFVDANILERFANVSEEERYRMDINEVKNLIYKNIYNNLTHIYKSKGTEKAFRNLMHCYGIGDNIVRFNAYGNNTTHTFDSPRQQTSVRKNYVDFNHPHRFDGLCRMVSIPSVANFMGDDYKYNSYFSRMQGFANLQGTDIHAQTGSGLQETAQLEVIFPKKLDFSDSNYFTTPFVTAALFGRYNDTASAPSDPDRSGDYYAEWRDPTAPWYYTYAVRTHLESKDVYFALDIPRLGIYLTSSVYTNVYDNQKWNISVRMKQRSLPYNTSSTDPANETPPTYDIEFVGYNVEAGVVRNQFMIPTASSDREFVYGDLRYGFGAKVVNWGVESRPSDNIVIDKTDILASSFRVYLKYLNDTELEAQALDPLSYGTETPHKNLLFYNDSPNITLTGAIDKSIPETVGLALNWDFAQVFGSGVPFGLSETNTKIRVQDASWGSPSLNFFNFPIAAAGGTDTTKSRYPKTNILQNVNRQFPGEVRFLTFEDVVRTPTLDQMTATISKRAVQSSQLRLPETINTDNNVNVLTRDDELYPRDATPSQMYFAFEKSMYGVVSQEIINLFSNLVAFNNLIGEVVNKYRGDYKGMRLIRELFFEKIGSEPDLDKFIDYYKWIDHSLSIFLQQLVPASADVGDGIRTIIEDHVLTRSKYEHKYPLLDYKGNQRWGGDEAKLEARAFGIEGLNYDWQFGHAPTTNSQAEHSIWWKQRAERDNTAFNTAALIDTARQTLNDIILSFNSASVDNLSTAAAVSYAGSTYAIRRFATPVKLQTAIVPDIGGGYNYPRGHKPDAVFPIMPSNTTETVPGRITLGMKKAIPDVAKEELRPVIKQEKRRVTSVFSGLLSDAANDVVPIDLMGTKYITPFIPYSSSVSPADGYGQEWQSLDGTLPASSAPEEFAGYHNDSYGDDYEVPMQGPFTNQHVGGHRHRHTDLNTGSVPDQKGDRAEAFQFSNPNGGTVIFAADDSRAGLQGITTNPQYRRDETAKRPVNIKNIQHRTGSLGTIAMGNFDKKYEIVSTTSRTANNAAFVKAEGTGSFTITVAGADEVGYIDHVTDYAKPIRPRTEHVIVSRFSAPGSPETAGDNQGGPGLDFEAAEFSPYNNLNYRNTTVRGPLRELLSERSERFGLKSGSSDSDVDVTADYFINVTASFHKTNRNTLRRVVSGNYGGPHITGSFFDNYYVQHMIPQSDVQYSWITASYTSLTKALPGYLPYDGLVSSSFGLISAINFVTASDFGAGLTAGSRRSDHEDDTYDAGSLVRTDFAGLNTTIIEPISASDFTLGYPLTADVYNYYNYGDIGSFALNTVNMGSFIQRIGAPPSDKHPDVLPNLIQHRQGPYGYSTWKQIRVGQSLLGRHLRKNNIYSHTPTVASPITTSIQGGTTTVPVRFGETVSLERAPLDESQKPLLYKLVVDAGETNSGQKLINETILKSTFGNNILYFDDSTFNETIGVNVDFNDPSYRTLLNIYGRKRGDDSTAPIQKLSLLEYTETVYPSSKNAYKSEIRGRTNFENNFWRDSRADRDTKGQTKKPTNAAGMTVKQSSWALDGQINFLSPKIPTAGWPTGQAGLTYAEDAGRRNGELQNEYVHFTAGTASNGRPGVLYARKQIYPATGSVVPKWGMNITEVIGAVGTGYTDSAVIPSASYGRGEAIWQAADDAGFFEGTSSVFTSASTNGNPFYDTYSQFFVDIRGKGKGYSVIPEFRITDHLEFYGNNEDDYLIENQNLFSIVGSPSGSTIPQNSAEENFYSIFSTSDFLKYFEIIKKDHDGIADPHTIKIKCKAIKKFVPYDGFYPAERTVQMAKQFTQDYSGSLHKVTGSEVSDQLALRSFMKPLFAPGILYNTIKAGLAVDYPILQSDMTTNLDKPSAVSRYRAKRAQTYQPSSVLAAAAPLGRTYESSSFAIFSSTHSASVNSENIAADTIRVDHFDGWDKRIPFEAIISPENYLANVRIGDDEPSLLASVDARMYWDGSGRSRYKKMMNNFLAESINFFLDGGQVSKIESLPQRDFKRVTPGQPYGMRIKMWRSMETGSARLASGSWGDFEVPQNVPVIVENNGFNPFTGEENTTGAPIDVTPRESFTMYSRPAAFGPPLGLYASGNYDQYDNFGGVNSQNRFPGTIYDFTPSNGVYGSHTPPYYDGEAWFDIIFWPRGLETSYVLVPPQRFSYTEGGQTEPYKPTLEEIFATPSEALFTTSGSYLEGQFAPGKAGVSVTGTPLIGSFTRKWRYDEESLKNVSGSSYQVTTANSVAGALGQNDMGLIGPAAGPFMNQWAMQLDSCLNIFNKNPEPGVSDDQRKWSIETKFETPMLNFNHITASDGTLLVSDQPNANVAIPRGMWHQFGRLPQGDEGVYMQVTDIPTQWLENHPAAFLKPDIAGISSVRNKSPYVNDITQAQTFFNAYSVPVGHTGSSEDASVVSLVDGQPVGTQPKVQSLIDVCGFSTEPVRIGEIRNKKSLFEAIVAVPFRVVDGERRFYETFNVNAEETTVSGRAYRKLVQAQRRYVFPPTFDFVNNPSVTPVSMYVFEFKHDFDINDLSMIWQNVAPNITTQAESSYSTISHELLANELLTDVLETQKAQFFNYEMPYIDLDKEIQWMVFKVKQRASRDYYTKTKRQTPQMPFYTDNWPYDYCSLVELAQIDAGIQFKKISPDRKVGYKELTPEEAAAFASRGDAGTGNRTITQPTRLDPSFGSSGGDASFTGDSAGGSTQFEADQETAVDSGQTLAVQVDNSAYTPGRATKTETEDVVNAPDGSPDQMNEGG